MEELSPYNTNSLGLKRVFRLGGMDKWNKLKISCTLLLPLTIRGSHRPCTPSHTMALEAQPTLPVQDYTPTQAMNCTMMLALADASPMHTSSTDPALLLADWPAAAQPTRWRRDKGCG